MKKAMMMTVMVFLAAAIFAQNGVITKLSGTVELKPAGQTSFIHAKLGDVVAKDTTVSTGFKSMALIEMGSTIVTVRPLTRLSLGELMTVADTETINVNLQTGRIRVDVNPPAGSRSNTTVRAPAATASVRGTSFEFDTRMLKVYHGTVAFKGGRGTVQLVSGGSSSWINPEGKAADPLEVTVSALQPPAPAGTESGNNHNQIPAMNQEGEISVDIHFSW